MLKRSPCGGAAVAAATLLAAVLLAAAAAWPEVAPAAERRLVIRISASTLTPHSGDSVTVTVRTRDRAGRPLAGARVVVRWGLPAGPARDARTTGRTGTVRVSRGIGAAAAGTTIRVSVTAHRAGQTRRAALELTVAGEPPPSGDRLEPGDLVYQGAFRLPGPSGDSSWGWSGDGLTYYPDGDPGGAGDGYAGSLFGIGHDWQHELSEVSIPAPVISADKDPADLPRAGTLQPFADVRGDLYPDLGTELRRADVEYLPAEDAGGFGRLFLCWGRHMQEGEANATHMACGLDLSEPDPRGPWSIGGYEDYVTSDYLFAVDPAWAAANAPGRVLATGRFRDGGQGTMGPSILLFDPAPGTIGDVTHNGAGHFVAVGTDIYFWEKDAWTVLLGPAPHPVGGRTRLLAQRL